MACYWQCVTRGFCGMTQSRNVTPRALGLFAPPPTKGFSLFCPTLSIFLGGENHCGSYVTKHEELNHARTDSKTAQIVQENTLPAVKRLKFSKQTNLYRPRKSSSIIMGLPRRSQQFLLETHIKWNQQDYIEHTFNNRSHPAKESLPGGQKDNWHLLRVLHGTVPLSGVTDTNFSPSATRSPLSLVRLWTSQEKSKLNLPELITNSCRVAFSLISTLKWREHN